MTELPALTQGHVIVLALSSSASSSATISEISQGRSVRPAATALLALGCEINQRHHRQVDARTTIVSDRDQAKKLNFGYSDDVSVFLNGDASKDGRFVSTSGIR